MDAGDLKRRGQQGGSCSGLCGEDLFRPLSWAYGWPLSPYIRSRDVLPCVFLCTDVPFFMRTQVILD